MAASDPPAATGSGVAGSDLAERDDGAWDAYVTGLPAAPFLQLTAWAVVKRANGWAATRIATTSRGSDGAVTLVGAQVLLRRAPGLPWTLGYAPRGPLATPLDRTALLAFTAAVRRRAAEMQLSSLRVEPDLEHGPAQVEWFSAAGWRPTPPYQPAVTRLIDLERREEALWGDLRPKWRQYVNKAGRNGVTVEPGGADQLPEFMRLYEETARRARFIEREEQSYRAVWDAFAPTGRARLLLARSSTGEPLATLFLLGCGRRMTELYGGMSLAGAELHANYVLKWEAIRRAREEGFAEYDLWGLASPGIAHFKAGFGGHEVRYVGGWELVLDPLGRAALEIGRWVSTGAGRVLRDLRKRR